MSKSKLVQEAIVDAKTLKNIALQNAKQTLEEAFAPQFNSMLKAKLEEMEEAEETIEEDLNLESLLAEVEEEDDLESEESENESPESEEDEDKDITDMSPEEVEDYIRKIAAEEFEKLENEQGEISEPSEEMPEDENVGSDDEIQVNEEEMSGEEDLDEFELDELLNELTGGDEEIEENDSLLEVKKLKTENQKLKKSLKESNDALIKLRESLSEINLLNSKLLYVNKLFNENNLNESQKVKIIKSFDKADTVKEAKLLYEALSTSSKVKKQPIKESLGFASKPIGVLNESQKPTLNNDFSRWEKLAGLK